MRIAVITGASSGLGAAFVRSIIAQYHLDEIWLIARRQERLEEFARGYSDCRFRTFALDLIDDSYSELETALYETDPKIRILINNAGYQSSGRFQEVPLADMEQMIRVNVLAATRIQKICDPYLCKDSISILTSSVLSYVPTPGQAVYSATKTYLYSLGRALREEYRGSGRGNVLVLCPGSMDTEMNPKELNPHSIYCDVNRIAENALRKAEQGASVYTPGFFYKIYRVISKIIPHTVLIRIVSRMYRR